MLLKKFKDTFVLDAKEYDKMKDMLAEENCTKLQVFSLLGLLGFGIMFIASLLVSTLSQNGSVYLACVVVSAVVAVASNFLLHKPAYKKFIDVFVYAFAFMLLYYGIVIGIFASKDVVTVSYIVFLMVVPMLFAYRTKYMNFVLIISIITYVIMAKQIQTPQLFVFNMTDVIPFGIVSLIMAAYNMKQKLNKAILESDNKYKSEYDQLTGLLNRRSYDNHVKSISIGDCVTPITACALDVNGLKRTNDELGHRAGDELIIGTARCLEEVFGRYGKCYRTGGDEFVIIMEGPVPSDDELLESVQKTCEKFEGEFIHGISIAAGIKACEDCSKIDELLVDADREMYDAKARYYAENGIKR